jgi:hypothetical protein
MQRILKVIGEIDLDEFSIPDEDSIDYINIRRSHVLEDALAIVFENKDPKSKFRILFLEENGEPEAGIDAGGLLKEFMTLVT